MMDQDEDFKERDCGYVESDEETRMAEKDLAEDAQWKIFQKNTFTRWANEHLKKADLHIDDLEIDLSDGLRLVALVEILSGHKFRHINKRPTFRTQKLENVTTILKYLEETEGLRLISIDSSHIVDCNLKLILGLIWALILHYSISVPLISEEENVPEDDKNQIQGPKQRLLSWVKQKMPSVPVRNFTTDWNDGIAIGALVDACAPGLCPDWTHWDHRKPLRNATEAMIAAEDWLSVPQLIRPEEMVDPNVDEKSMMTYISQFPNARLKEGAPLRVKLNPSKVRAYGPGLELNENRIGVLAKFYVETVNAGKGQLDVLVINSRGVRETCEVIFDNETNQTYSCMYEPRLEGEHRIVIKYGGQEIPNSPFRVNVKGIFVDPSKVTVSGPGVQKSELNCVGRRTHFNVHTQDAGNGNVDCYIIDPHGRTDAIKPRVTCPGGDGCFVVEYTPKEVGIHQVVVQFAEKQIPNSPFQVEVAPRESGKAAAVAALSAMVQASEFCHGTKQYLPIVKNVVKQNDFHDNSMVIIQDSNSVEINNETPLPPDPPFLDSNGYKSEESHFTDNSLKEDSCIDGIIAEVHPELAYATGRGVQSRGVRVQDRVEFSVHTERAGDQAPLSVTMTRADGSVEPVEIHQTDKFLWDCSYSPQRPGKYTLNIRYGNGHIQHSPYTIVVGPYKKSAIRAFGPGLVGGIVNYPNLFTIVCNGDGAGLGFLIEGPSEAKVLCQDNGDDSALVTYTVSQPGEYAVHITCYDEDIPGSPYMPIIASHLEDIHPNKLRIHGPGIEKMDLSVGHPTEFYIDGLQDAIPPHLLRSLNESLLHVDCHDASGNLIPVQSSVRPDGTVVYTYKPMSPGIHTIYASVAGASLKGSPFRVTVAPEIQPEKVKLWGPGLQSATRKKQSYFFIDPQEVFSGQNETELMANNPVSVNIVNDQGQSIPARLSKQPDNTVRVEYIPSPLCTNVHITPLIGGTPAKKTIRVPVSCGFDVSQIKVQNLDTTISSHSTSQFVIYTSKDAVDILEHLTVKIQSVNNADICLPVRLTLASDDRIVCTFSTTDVLCTAYNVHIMLDNENIVSEAYTINVVDDIASTIKSVNTDSSCKFDKELLQTTNVDNKHFSEVEINNNGFDESTKSIPAVSEESNIIQQMDSHVHFKKCPMNGDGINKSISSHVNIHRIFITNGYHTKECEQKDRLEPQPHLNCNGLRKTSSPSENELSNGVDCRTGINQDTAAVHTTNCNPLPVQKHPPRPFITEKEKTEIVAKSKWPQPMPEQYAYNITAQGLGLDKAIVNQSAEFTIHSENVPPAPLSVTIAGPSEAKIQCSDNGNGTCGVSYIPHLPGCYTINVVYNDESHISGSPFFVQAYPADKPNLNVDNVICYGMGVDSDEVYKASYVKFTVDASAIDPHGEGTVTAVLTSPDNGRSACQVLSNKDGKYLCNYTPLDEGRHQIDVTYEGLAVPGSPFHINVVPGCDPSRVKAHGPGLENGPHLKPGVQTSFTVDLTGAGQGGLGLAVEGPSEAPIDCHDNRDGTCTVYYTPSVPGAYAVYIRFNDVNVPGSPFHVNVKAKVDPNQVRCYGSGLESGLLRAGWPAYFTVDTKNAGDARLRVMYTPKSGGELCRANVQPLGGGSEKDSAQQHYHKVTYTPETDGPCRIEVTYDDVHIPGSPFIVNIRKACEPERVRVLGAGVEGPVLASLPATFTVDARDAGMGDLTLGLTDPKGQSVPVRVVPLSVDSESFVTNGVVPSVTSLASGDVSDTGLLSCGIKKVIPVGKENVITVDTSLGGKGRLTCQVIQHPTKQPSATSTLLPVETEDNGDGTTCVYYKPTQLSELNVELRYGGQLIPNGEFSQKSHSSMYRPVVFRLPAPRNKANIEAIVLRPSGLQQQVPVKVNDDETITITYDPVEHGMHELRVNIHSPVKSGSPNSTITMPLQGSPYKFYVDIAGTGRITAYGPGLSHGITSQLAEFTIVTKEAGVGGLSVSVEGPSKAEIQCVENSDGTCSVSYLPLAPGQYTITIKFADEHIPGSPFIAKITGDLLKRSQVSMGAPSDIALEAIDEDIATLTASVHSASGREEPCVLKSISFTPKEVGEHLVSVFQAGKHIANSPFRIRVSEKEIGDPRRVRVYGPGLISGLSNKPNQFTVNTQDAGYAGLSLSIEGPSNADIECHDNHDGTCTVIYTPTEPGQYVINVKYADVHVPNSPFCVEIGGEPSMKMMERITRRRDASKVTCVGSRCELSLRLTDTNPNDLSATITSPSGHTTRCEVVPVDNEHYNIKFIPQEMGEHLVAVKHKGIQISGSPFHFTVGPITDGVANKVRAMGSGLQEGWTHITNEFTIYTREAGAGTLSIAMEGPSKAEIDCDERRDGSSAVLYRVTAPGTYICSLKFNDEHIPCSPFRIHVSDSTQTGRVASYTLPSRSTDLHSARSTSSKEETLQIGRPIAFTVHHVETPGHILKAKVTTPSNTHEDAIVQPIDQDQFVIRFVPREGGPHLVHVHSVPIKDADKPDWSFGPNSVHRSIQGSPFRLVVSQHAADPGMVYATGEGLRRGKVDMKNSFFVNTTNAGCGILNVTVDGPSKATVTSQEHDEGYAFFYTPTVPGVYEITIKYGGNFHISGSPFRVEVTGTPRSEVNNLRSEDRQSNVILETVGKTMTGMSATTELENQSSGSHPELVTCQGLGLKRAELDRVNYFNVDASQAGNDVLLIGIYGPKQASEEVVIKHLSNNQYTVSYRVFESGKHFLVVKWGDQHVPGSPFLINVP
ncbi:Filamin-A [Schistosoma japonicum]|nr:Filamin-A [Schistosoma japonicum]